jgi:hypothetical protein
VNKAVYTIEDVYILEVVIVDAELSNLCFDRNNLLLLYSRMRTTLDQLMTGIIN